MRLTCKACGAVASFETWAEDPYIRDSLAIAFSIPESVGKFCPGYLAMFRPAGGRGLQWPKVHRLIKELSDLVKASHVQGGCSTPARPCTAGHWGKALERLMDNPPRQLPLKNHNYLIKVVYDLADQADREAEKHRNEMERTGSLLREVAVKGEPERLDPNWMRKVWEEKKRGQK